MSAANSPGGMAENDAAAVLLPEMLTINEVVERSNGKLTYSGVRRLCLENRLVHIRVGAKYLINAQRLCEFLDGGKGVM